MNRHRFRRRCLLRHRWPSLTDNDDYDDRDNNNSSLSNNSHHHHITRSDNNTTNFSSSSSSKTIFFISNYVISLIIFVIIQSSSMTFVSALQKVTPVTLDEPFDALDPGRSISKVLDAFFATGYDKRVRPNYGGTPVEVGVSMFLISISTVSEVNMDFTTDFYFRQGWNDPRLSFKPLPGKIEELYVGAEVADRIWVPDTFFANEKSAYFHKATTFNTFLRIGAKGDVYRSIRLTVTASCPMDLQYFPMDSQLCAIEIESYGYSMADIRYTWSKGKGSVGLDDKLSLPQFRVVGHRQLDKVIALSTGNYSRLVAEIQFARSLGFYLIQIYIPASLIVVISWVSFWLHRNATPARVSLGVTTVLTMTTLMSSTNSQLPKISYVKSIDVFLGTCFVMVFASLLEYATVGYLGKRIAMRKSRAEQIQKAQEEQRKKLQQAQQQNQQQQVQPQFPPPPIVNLYQPYSQQPPIPPPPILPLDESDMTSDNDMPPPVPPAPVGIVNPMICPYAGSPRQIPTYKTGTGGYYGVGGGYPRPPPPGQTTTTYDRFGPPFTSCQIRTCTPTHVVCSGVGDNIPVSGPGQQPQPQQQSATTAQQQTQQSQQLKNNIGAGEPRKSIIKDTSNRKDGGQPPSGGAGVAPIGHPRGPIMMKTIPGKPFFGSSSKSKPNLNKLLGVGPSDIDKYSRVIFPVCFICFNLMYWIIYSHISDNIKEDIIPFMPSS